MSAYGIEYLDDAMRNLGEMTDYAVNACGMDLEDFWKLFLTTGYAEKFGGRIGSGGYAGRMYQSYVYLSGVCVGNYQADGG